MVQSHLSILLPRPTGTKLPECGPTEEEKGRQITRTGLGIEPFIHKQRQVTYLTGCWRKSPLMSATTS